MKRAVTRFSDLVTMTQACAESDGVKLTKKDTRLVLECAFGNIASQLREYDADVVLPFGRLKPKQRKGYTGRNPATGEPVQVAPMITVVFRPSAQFKDSLNPGN